jgi:hypothetical protein
MASPVLGDVIELTVVVRDLDRGPSRVSAAVRPLKEHHRLDSKEFGFKRRHLARSAPATSSS